MKTKLSLILLLIAITETLVPISYAKTLEDLLVEKGVITKTEADATGGQQQAKVYWNQGTRLEFPDSGFTSGFSVLIQERYTYTDNDSVSGEENSSSFDIERARLKIFGTALHNEFNYLLNTEFAGDKGAKLLDASLTWNACDWSTFRMGQYKPTYGRQFNSGDAELQFPDRTEVSDYFSVGRQGGASTTLSSEDKDIVATAGVFNGLSDGEGVNEPGVDTYHSGFVDAHYIPIGEMKSYVEGDIDYTEDLAVSLGAAFGYQDNRNDLDSGLEKVRINGAVSDVNVKLKGFSLHGEYFYNSVDTETYSDNVEPNGFYTQIGYFLIPKKFEIATRYGRLDCDSGQGLGGACEDFEKVNEFGVSLNYFFWKNYLKAAFLYRFESGWVEAGNADEDSNKWIFQLSSMF